MKKKSTRISISTKKIVLLSSIIFAGGIFILAFSFLISVPSSKQDIVSIHDAEVKDIETEQKAEQVEVPEIALAPVPDDEIPVIIKPDDDAQIEPEVIKKDPIEVPVKTKDGKIVIILDDGGHQLSQSKSFVDLPFPVTIAVLPQLSDSVETADLVRNSGNELFLHQPMQAMNLNLSPGPGAILPDMTTGEAVSVLRQNILEIGPVVGVNNHEGSLITSDRNLVGAVIDACSDLGVLFLDSRTTAQTTVPMVAMERGIEVLDRDIFIDNQKDKAYMREMLEKGLEIADQQGYVIMIGHVTTPLLAPLLDEMYDELSAQGYTFTTPSKL